MAKNVLRAEVDLKTAKANRGAKELTRETKKFGDAGSKATGDTNQGLSGMAKKLLGGMGVVAGLGMAAKGLMAVYEWQVKINRALADFFRMEQQRMQMGAMELGSPINREVSSVTGWTLQDVNRRALLAAAKYDVTPGGFKAAAQKLYSRAPDPQAAARMLDDALVFATARGVPAGVAGSATALVMEQFGMDTQAKQRVGLAQIGAVAKGSAYGTGDFAGILSRGAAPLKKAGLSYEQQLSWASAFSVFAPDDPKLTGMAMEQMARLPFNKTPFIRELLSQAGRNPDSLNIEDMRFAIARYLRSGGGGMDRVLKLEKETGIPKRILVKVQQAGEGMWQRRYEAGMAAAEGPMAEWTDVQRLQQEKLAKPGYRQRAAFYRAQVPKTDFGKPGTLLESQQIIASMIGEAAAIPGYQAGKAEFAAETIEQAFGAFAEEAPKGEQLEKLYQLNLIYPGVVRGLKAILAAPASRAQSREAHKHAGQIYETRQNANTWHIIGAQSEYLAAYELALQRAIQFIRKAQIEQGDIGQPGAVNFGDLLPGFPPAPSRSGGSPTTQPSGPSPGGDNVSIGVQYNILESSRASLLGKQQWALSAGGVA